MGSEEDMNYLRLTIIAFLFAVTAQFSHDPHFSGHASNDDYGPQ
jgi:hypothetical protein